MPGGIRPRLGTGHTPCMHSVRSDVWAELKRQTDVESVAVDFATTRKDLNAAAGNLGRLFERYEKIRARLDGAGVIAQMKLSPMLEAAYREWIRAGSDEPLPRVFTEIPDPPIGPEPKE